MSNDIEKLNEQLDDVIEAEEGEELTDLVSKLKGVADRHKKISNIENAMLDGFSENDKSFHEIAKLLKVIVSQLETPLQTNIEYDRMYPDKIKIANLDEIKRLDLNKPEWYKEPNLKPIIDALQKQYNLSLVDIVSGNKGTVTSSQSTCIRGQKGYKIYITDVTVTNYSTNSAYCEIFNGNTVWTIPAPINNGVGGATLHFTTPLPGDEGRDWNFRVSPATNIVYCSMVGFRKSA